MASPSSSVRLFPQILLPLLVLVVFNVAPLPHIIQNGLSEAAQAQKEDRPELVAVRLRQVVEREPWRVTLWEPIGRALLQQGLREQGIIALQTSRAAGVLSQAGSSLLADSLEANSDWEGALQVWETLRQSSPQNVGLYPRLVYLYRRLGYLDQAVEAAQRWLELQPNDSQAAYQLGLLLSLSQLDEAVALLEQAAVLDPAYEPARAALSRAAALAGDSPEPAYADTLVGRELAGLGAWDLAERAFEQAVAANPSYAEAWAFLGEARAQNGKDGLEALRAGEKANPDSVLVQALLALYWGRANALDQALIHLKAAAALEPQRGVWQLELGALTARQGNLPAAQAYYETATALEPDTPQMWVELARFSVAYNVDVRGLGLPAARTAYQLAPEDAGVLDAMGMVFLALGDANTAERFLQRALIQDPELAAGYLHLGQVYLIRADTEKARGYLVRAEQLDPDGEIGAVARRLLER